MQMKFIYNWPNCGSLSGKSNSGGSDAFLAKISSSGELQWTRLLGGSGDEAMTSIDVSPDGSFIWQVGAQEKLMAHKSGSLDVLTAKYSQAGELLWTESIGTSSFERRV